MEDLVLLWKFGFCSGCPVVVVFQSPNCPDYIQWSSGGTYRRARSFMMELYNPVSHRVFLESSMVVPAAYSADAYSVHYGPLEEMTPSGCAAAFQQGIIRDESLE